jgi:hypothetical protein
MRRFVVLALLVVAGVMLVPAGAGATPTLKSLAKSLTALQKTVKSQTASIKDLRAKTSTQAATISTLQSTVTTQAATIAALQSVVGVTPSEGLRKGLADIAANPALSLSWLPTYLTLDNAVENGVMAPNIVFKGANLHVESSTSEADDSGTGNLIVGWDTATSGPARTGSNNLVCGDMNAFASSGGFVAGFANTIEAGFASIDGGANNFANASFSTVSGGHSNVAQSFGATISGGNAVTLNVSMPTIYPWSAGGTFHNP